MPILIVMAKTKEKRHLTPEMHFEIVRDWDQRRTLKELAEKFNVNSSMIGKFLKLWNAQNRPLVKLKNGRASLTTHLDDCNIVRT
uniref:Uncharacterized protein n=1 Tax=Caenorhabditis japonica TaxID=281687 RepID=A0A8R1EMD2_CAEJA